MTISNKFPIFFFIFWSTVWLMGSPNNTFENLVFMKWWNGESFDTQKWQIHLGPPDDELIQLIFIFIMHLLMAIWWCVWLKFKNTGPLLTYIITFKIERGWLCEKKITCKTTFFNNCLFWLKLQRM